MFRNSALKEVTLKKNFQWGNMQTEYRDEQLLATEILKVLFPKDSYSIRQEEPVEECKAVLDIAIIPKNKWQLKRIAIRMMGEIHENNRKRIKDEDQKTLLIQQGWRVYDFWKDRMPNLWNLEIEGAAREIRKELLI